jgi:dienelactone hydrolase
VGHLTQSTALFVSIGGDARPQACMAVVEVGHAAAAVGGCMGGGVSFEVAKEEPPLAEGVPAAEGDENGAAA